jgi:energy-coupling factor transport system substrate-specific component
MDIVFGFWFAGSTFTAYIVRKPGVAFAASMIAVIAEILAGNAAGAILLLTGLVQGAGSEVPFAATRWRRYGWPVLLASGATAAVFSFVYNWFRFDYASLAFGLLVAMFAIRVTSGMVLGAVLPKLAADRMRTTGVFDGLAIEREESRDA